MAEWFDWLLNSDDETARPLPWLRENLAEVVSDISYVVLAFVSVLFSVEGHDAGRRTWGTFAVAILIYISSAIFRYRKRIMLADLVQANTQLSQKVGAI
ncbi:MAG TPA: hypothetical protein VGJ82_21305, partial [Thermoanaerobaculia bacterium]